MIKLKSTLKESENLSVQQLQDILNSLELQLDHILQSDISLHDPDEEINSVENSISEIKKKIDQIDEEIKLSKTVVSNVRDIQKLYFGMNSNNRKLAAIRWHNFYNKFNSDEELFNHLTKDGKIIDKDSIAKIMLDNI